MTALVLRGDARRLPLPDASVDLIVTSPSYFALRSYQDGGQHYAGQVGAEPTPAEYIDALLECTVEMARVLKPSGSIFVNLGDKYSQRVALRRSSHQDGLFPGRPELAKDWTRDRALGLARMPAENVMSCGQAVPEKSLMLLPERYRIGCVDRLGLIVRETLIWAKPNGMPESVTDRARRSHEDWVHLVKQPRYYSAVDAIRERSDPANLRPSDLVGPGQRDMAKRRAGHGSVGHPGRPLAFHPLGKLPGSVWEIATEPLRVPEQLGFDHFAAFPTEWPRRLILGWTPPGICVVCGEGRRPVVDRPGLLGGDNNPDSRNGTRRRSTMDGGSAEWRARIAQPDRIVGYACACTPYTDHPGSHREGPRNTKGWAAGTGDRDCPSGGYGGPNAYPRTGPWREWHLNDWTPPPTRPAVVLDPFGGTGTTALVASALGRTGVTVDRSADYCRIATWRTTDPGERARAMRVEKPPVQVEGQMSLLGGDI